MAQPPQPGDAQAQAMSSMMGPMLVMFAIMIPLMLFDSIRISLSNSAGSVIEPLLPFHSEYFVPTVFVVGSSIMVVNTIIRSLFTDPLKQAHHAHRSKQSGTMLTKIGVSPGFCKNRCLAQRVFPTTRFVKAFQFYFLWTCGMDGT